MGKVYMDEIIAGIFMIITVGIVILNISMRYFFNSPIQSAEEIATICFIWAVFLGGASCFRKKMHMGIDIFTQIFPPKVSKILSFATNFLILVMSATFLYLSVKFSLASRLKPTAVLGISSIYVNFSLVVCFFLITVYSLKDIFSFFRKQVKTHE